MWQRGIIPPLLLELSIAELYDFTPLEPEQVYLIALETAVETLGVAEYRYEWKISELL